MVFVLFIRYSALRQSVRNWFVISIILTETIGGGWIYAPSMLTFVESKNTCLTIMLAFCFLNFNVLTCTIFGITIYQWVKIAKPFVFLKINIDRIAKVYILACWLAGLCIATHPCLEVITAGNFYMPISTDTGCLTKDSYVFKFMMIISSCLTMPLVVVIVVIQILLLGIVKTHLAYIKAIKYRNSRIAQESLEDNSVRQSPDFSIIKQADPILSNIKAARVLIIIVILYLLGWLPTFIIMTTLTFCDQCHKNVLYHILIVMLYITILAAIVNPWLFALRLSEFKNAFREMRNTTKYWMCCCCCCCLKCARR